MKHLFLSLLVFFIYAQLQATIRYVNPAATGANNGTSWANAHTSLHTTLSVVNAGDTIYMAAGTYNVTAGSYTLVSGIHIFGGFAATGNPSFASRNWNTYQTIFQGNTTNSIFSSINFSASTYLDGVHITGIGINNQGGAMYVSGQTFHISNTRFFNNTSNAQGGIFYVNNGTVNIDNCTITNNNSNFQGGFIYSLYGTVTINNSTFTNNNYATQGSIIYNLYGDFTVNNSRFLNNSSSSMFYIYGGRGRVIRTVFANNTGSNSIIADLYQGVGDFYNCLIVNNTATSGGAILFNGYGSDSRLTIVNSTIYGNSSNNTGVGVSLIFSSYSAASRIANSIIWGNTPLLGRIGNNGILPEVYYSIVEGAANTANHVYNTDPVFVNTANAATGGLQLQPGSPAIDAGDNASVPYGLAADIIGNTRVINAIVDMGAYEYIPPTGPVIVTSTGTTSFTVSGSPVVVDAGVLVTDPASPTLATGTVAITNNFSTGDILSFTNTTGMGNITASYNSSTGVLSLVSAGGTATLAQWQNALRAISFTNSNGNTNLNDRTVSFTVNDGTSTSNTATKIIELETAPCLATTSSTTQTICNSALPYTWNGQTYTTAGTYNVVLQNAAGCDSTATLILNVSPVANCITLNLTATPESCERNDGRITATGSGGVLPYRFSVNGGSSYQTNNIFQGLTAQNYQVILKDAAGDSVIVSIRVNADMCLQLSATPASCNNNNGRITATGSGGRAPYQFSIDNTNFQSSNSFTNLAAGAYEITLRDADGLTVRVPITVGQSQCLSFNANFTNTSCGRNNGVISVVVTEGVRPFSYSINGNAYQPDSIFNSLSAGAYTVSVRDANDLVATADLTIATSSLGAISAGNDTTVLLNQTIQLQINDLDNYGYNQFSWSPSTGLSNPYIRNPSATVSRDISYTVTATAPNGCQASSTINIKTFLKGEIYVPTAFTPNGDRLNDTLKAVPVGIKEFKYFTVFNRWGQRVFHTTAAEKGWDGKINGTNNINQMLVWVAEGIAHDGSTVIRRGSVMLIR